MGKKPYGKPKIILFRKPSVQKTRSKFGKSVMKHTTNTSSNTRTTKKTFADKIGIKSKRKGKTGDQTRICMINSVTRSDYCPVKIAV